MHIDERVVFIHNPRAAGTAIRRALNHGADPNANIPWPGSVPSRWTNNRKHLFARQLKAELPAEVWETRTTFAVVRNPWERVVSLYGLFRRPTEPGYQTSVADAKQPYKLAKLIGSLAKADALAMRKGELRRLAWHAFRLGFRDWLAWCDEWGWNSCRYLDSDLPLTRIPQSEWVENVDCLFRFEDMDEIADFLRSRGYPAPVRENATEHKDWRRYYDAETYDRVAEAFAVDIAAFGY